MLKLLILIAVISFLPVLRFPLQKIKNFMLFNGIRLNARDVFPLIPIALILVYEFIPIFSEKTLINILFLCAIVCFYYIGLGKDESLSIGVIPSLLTFLVGVDIVHDYIRYGVGGIGKISEAFFLFLVVIDYIHYVLKYDTMKNELLEKVAIYKYRSESLAARLKEYESEE